MNKIVFPFVPASSFNNASKFAFTSASDFAFAYKASTSSISILFAFKLAEALLFAIFSANLSDASVGLVIIDEEQRFGVAHKERIKKIKNNVHLLTLTATPIPRTLHMSLLGIKELSLIKTPPVDRKSVETKVIKFDKTIIKNAIFHMSLPLSLSSDLS